jgi:hypothetical protein
VSARSYEEFLASKVVEVRPSGFVPTEPIAERLFDYQRDIVSWALQLGKAALWLQCGLGKTGCSIEWAHHVAQREQRPVIILTPLAVAPQFVSEAKAQGRDVEHCREGGRFDGPRLVVTNYERLHHFNVDDFVGIVADESSRMKDYTSKTRNEMIDSFRDTPFKLSCTATPAPNDFVELGNQSEFLGVMSRTEMLSRYFVHDGGSTQDWRLKGHAQSEFWKWCASWAVHLERPDELGYDGTRHVLPPLNIHEHQVATPVEDARDRGLLFNFAAETLIDQRRARKKTIAERVKLAAALANDSDQPWIVWCELNDESDALTAAIPDAVEVRGSMTIDEKERAIVAFLKGEKRVLVTKPSIAGHGVNFQHCADVAFVGIGHSWELWHQAVRRTWRFGQKRPVNCHVITSDLDGNVLANLKRKQADAERMSASMAEAMSKINRAALRGTRRDFDEYRPTKKMEVPQWLRSE